MRSVYDFLRIIGVMTVCASGAVWAQGLSPDEAARRMHAREGFVVDLVAAEPLVRQPVAIDFDDRGRLWVIQYLQYPNPAGLERVAVDRYSRTTYDRVPEPPPRGPVGADRITILEDTDGDGRADRAKDFVSGLNLTTGFAFGYGGVFVLQVPYLLFYPDRDRDDVPDGDPEVLLTGFGMEDSSSLANSLVWGPDGWLYGTQGTNLMANIRGIEFEQGLWRYHPRTKQFELFAEGGSNMWGLDFDRQGNLLAGTNYGGYIVFHGVQGAYYQKSFEKHGELHNPFAFGYFKHVPHENFQGGHVTVGGFLYEGISFPSEFRGKYIAVDTLGHAVRWHSLERDGSTFRSRNGGVLVEANDAWFAPSDSVMGPDGAVYFADWHDQRTAHPDPDAEWDRSNGRVFRVRWAAAPALPSARPVDPQSLSSRELVDWLSSDDGWKVTRARRVLAERGDRSVVNDLLHMLKEAISDDVTLQALWVLHTLDGVDDSLTVRLLNHPSDIVRAWAIRLQGDSVTAPSGRARRLEQIADQDSSPIVISQLASTLQRLPADVSLPIAQRIASRTEFTDDPHVPLLLWWAVEKHALAAADPILTWLNAPTVWNKPLVRNELVGRLMRRYAGDGSQAGLAACARLLAMSPDDAGRRALLEELDAGLKMLGRTRTPGLPPGTSFTDIAVVRVDTPVATRRVQSLPPALAEQLQQLWSDQTTDPLILRLATRIGIEQASARTRQLAMDSSQSESIRLAAFSVLEELADGSCLEDVLNVVGGTESDVIQSAAIRVLGRFADPRVTSRLLNAAPQLTPAMRSQAWDALLARPDSASALLREVDAGELLPNELTVDQLRRVALHDHAEINALVRKHWGEIRPGTPEEKLAEIRRIQNDLRAAAGDPLQGRVLFEKHCATCHKLHGTGKEIGPDLTKANRQDLSFLLVSMVDPGAQVRKEYLNYTVLTLDGRVLSGLLVEDTAAHVVILDAKGERTTLARDDLDQIEPAGVSLMPENILKPLTSQELRDLFAFLQRDGD
ncbi:MAG: c-type cytochrome [Planctomycetaceae bacterium]|nr:c-type cytochrome [Planctomycetaceae bacterium]